MEFSKEEFYHNQKIIKQYINDKDKLFIITFDKSNGKYTLWQDGKKISTKNNPMDFDERMEE